MSIIKTYAKLIPLCALMGYFLLFIVFVGIFGAIVIVWFFGGK